MNQPASLPRTFRHPWEDLPGSEIDRRRRIIEEQTGEPLPPTSEMIANVTVADTPAKPINDPKVDL